MAKINNARKFNQGFMTSELCAASILDMKFKDVLIACMGGVLLAGIIMGLASAGLLGALSGLFAV